MLKGQNWVVDQIRETEEKWDSGRQYGRSWCHLLRWENLGDVVYGRTEEAIKLRLGEVKFEMPKGYLRDLFNFLLITTKNWLHPPTHTSAPTPSPGAFGEQQLCPPLHRAE